MAVSEKIKLSLIISAVAAVVFGGATLTVASVNDKNYGQEPVAQEAPQEVKKKETEVVDTPYATKRVEDATIPKGETRVTQAGVNGKIAKHYTVTYRDGVEVSRSLDYTEVVQEPVDEIVAVGTYVAPAPVQSCPNGSYVNSAGNVVCRPSDYNAGGATAICRDGSYSYSQSHRGT